MLLQACAATGLAGITGCLAGPETRPTATPRDTPSTGTPPPTTPEDSPGPTDTAGDRVAWRQSLPAVVSDAPTLDGDRLFAGTEDGTVAALSRADGSEQWAFGATDPIQGSPVVAGGIVLAVSGGVGLGDDHSVHALDAATGTGRWTFAPEEWYLDVLGTAGGVAYVATYDDAISPSGQKLYALSLSDGAERWSVEVGDNRGGLVTDETVYVPSTDVVDAVGTDGSPRWRYEGGEYQYRTLAVADDTVALVTGSSPGDWTVHGLDVATGEERWAFDDWVAYTTRAVDDRLFVGGEKIARVDPASGERVWEADQRAALYDAPVADGTLYVAGRTAAALAVDDGTVRWRTDLDVHLASPAGLAGGRLLVHKSVSRDDRNRNVLALDAADGDRAWEFVGHSEVTTPTVGDDRAFLAERADVLALAG